MSPKTPSPIIAILLILGGAVFGVLGGLHAIYTLLELRNPRRLVPVDPSVAQAMANSPVRLSGGGTDMWRAWIGFNFSHSLGVLLFAALAIWAGARIRMLPVGIVAALTLIGCVYLTSELPVTRQGLTGSNSGHLVLSIFRRDSLRNNVAESDYRTAKMS